MNNTKSKQSVFYDSGKETPILEKCTYIIRIKIFPTLIYRLPFKTKLKTIFQLADIYNIYIVMLKT